MLVHEQPPTEQTGSLNLQSPRASPPPSLELHCARPLLRNKAGTAMRHSGHPPSGTAPRSHSLPLLLRMPSTCPTSPAAVCGECVGSRGWHRTVAVPIGRSTFQTGALHLALLAARGNSGAVGPSSALQNVEQHLWPLPPRPDPAKCVHTWLNVLWVSERPWLTENPSCPSSTSDNLACAQCDRLSFVECGGWFRSLGVAV